MLFSEKFRDRFRELADSLGVEKHADCAKIIGISKMTFINAYGLGLQPPIKIVKRVAKFFKVSVDYLLGQTNEKN